MLGGIVGVGAAIGIVDDFARVFIPNCFKVPVFVGRQVFRNGYNLADSVDFVYVADSIRTGRIGNLPALKTPSIWKITINNTENIVATTSSNFLTPPEL